MLKFYRGSLDFNLGKDVLRPKRGKLSDDNFEIMVFLRGYFLQDLDLVVFPQIALIEYTTVGDLEYFFGYGIEIFFFNQGPIIRHGVKKIVVLFIHFLF